MTVGKLIPDEIPTQSVEQQGSSIDDINMSPGTVTIITQAFNEELYIAACIESVLSQTYASFNYILIDNGSTDGTLEIMKQYATKDHRIQIIHNAQNQKYEFWILHLKDLVRGAFFVSLDADDWLSDKFLEVCLNTLERDNSDIACTLHAQHQSDGRVTKSPLFTQETVISRSAFYEYIRIFTCHEMVWAKMYRTTLLEDMDLSYVRRNIESGSDTGFDGNLWWELMSQSHKVSLIPLYLYHRRADHDISVKGYYHSRILLPHCFRFILEQEYTLLSAIDTTQTSAYAILLEEYFLSVCECLESILSDTITPAEQETRLIELFKADRYSCRETVESLLYPLPLPQVVSTAETETSTDANIWWSDTPKLRKDLSFLLSVIRYLLGKTTELQNELASSSEYFGEICAEKDQALAQLQNELVSSSEQFGIVCKEKDNAIAQLQNELVSSSEQFGVVCKEKDNAIAQLQNELASSSEQFGEVCAEKNQALEQLRKELAFSSEQFGEVCAEKDQALVQLQNELASSSEQFEAVCTEKDNAIEQLRELNAAEISMLTAVCADREARILVQQAKLDDYAEKYSTLGKALRTVLKERALKKKQTGTQNMTAKKTDSRSKNSVLICLSALLVCASFLAVYFGSEARTRAEQVAWVEENTYVIEVDGLKKTALPEESLIAEVSFTPLDAGYYLSCVISIPGESCDGQTVYAELTDSDGSRAAYQMASVERQDYAELMDEPMYRMAGAGITLTANQLRADTSYLVRLFREKSGTVLYTGQTWEISVP